MTGSAIQCIVGTVAQEHVVQGISGPVDRRRAGQGEMLDIGAKGIGDAAVHGVDTFIEPIR